MEKISITSPTAATLLELVRKEASRCFATAAYYQAIPKKSHLFERWYNRAQKWQAIEAELEAEALKL